VRTSSRNNSSSAEKVNSTTSILMPVDEIGKSNREIVGVVLDADVQRPDCCSLSPRLSRSPQPPSSIGCREFKGAPE
jgi:hypothetical protein